MSMTPREAYEYMRENFADEIRAAVEAAPPLPQDAIDLLRTLNCPVGSKRIAGAA